LAIIIIHSFVLQFRLNRKIFFFLGKVWNISLLILKQYYFSLSTNLTTSLCLFYCWPFEQFASALTLRMNFFCFKQTSSTLKSVSCNKNWVFNLILLPIFSLSIFLRAQLMKWIFRRGRRGIFQSKGNSLKEKKREKS